MAKVLIVDDEKMVRRGLVHFLSEHVDRFQLVGEARNGVEALELVYKLNPDILITDIRMPKMDGIELVKKVKESHSSTVCIVLSGYEDFSYVHGAFVNGTIEYILKPLDESKLLEVLNKAKEMIDQEKNNKSRIVQKNMQLNESLPFLQTKYLKELCMRGTRQDESEILNKFEYYQLEIFPRPFYVAIISIDNFKFYKFRNEANQGQTQLFILQNIVSETVKQFSENVSFETDEGIVVIFHAATLYMLQQIGNRLTQNLTTFFKLPYTIGFSDGVHTINDWQVAYSHAKEAISHKYFTNGFTIQAYDPIFSPNKELAMNWPDLVDHYSKHIRLEYDALNRDELKKVLAQFKNDLIETSGSSFIIHNILVDVFAKISIEQTLFKRTMFDYFGENYSYEYHLNLFDTFEGLYQYTEEMYCNIMEAMIAGSGKRQTTKSIELAVKYLHSNYMKNLTLRELADFVFMNPNHLSTVFKEQTGDNFIDYLTKVRIDHAKKLLLSGEYKHYEIARMVGYEDPVYFSKVFKKLAGNSPSKYCESNNA